MQGTWYMRGIIHALGLIDVCQFQIRNSSVIGLELHMGLLLSSMEASQSSSQP